MRGIPRRIKNARNAQTRQSAALQAQSTKITTCVIANCFARHINHLQEYGNTLEDKRQQQFSPDISNTLDEYTYN